ncbi:hypothetical protein [Sinorhizobium mexicanum]|uniref:Uncharacterized protein n=1 Tax=Sinorhizobium mexicanum TaxID=375549 RepID=A0A859QF11_9HYPH|nr:hypothetical protein [Sinorhizobium mexicanum]MBP1885583.1 hypothetical protein [Sinorhizobium mexicanum]QLL63602.1 hypothetical protein FKV68_20235 [Sinorhizobium mexicanum]
MRTFKLMPDYHCFPLWENASGAAANVDPASLPVPVDLILRLNSWAAKFDETLNLDDPIKSGFNSEPLEQAFLDEGRHLCIALRAQLGDGYLVTYEGGESD